MTDILDTVPFVEPGPSVRPVARLIIGDEEQVLTYERSESCIGALAQGLADYLSKLEIDWKGQTYRFKKVYTFWAEPENVATFPSAAIVMTEPGVYGSSQMTPAVIQVADGTGRYVRYVAEVELLCAIVIYTTDNEERKALTVMLEDAFEPREDTTGLRLALPYYFDAHATYEKLANLYDDDAASVQARKRRTVFTVQALLPQFVPVGAIVNLNAQACVTVTDGDDL